MILTIGLLGKAYSQSAPPISADPDVQQDSFTLNITNEGGVDMVLMQDLFKVVKQLFPEADLRWDPGVGIMQIEADRKKIQVLSRYPSIIIDGRSKTMPHPVKIRQGHVLLPVETVQALLGALGINFDYSKEKESTSAPLATSTSTSASTIHAPAVPTTLLAPARGNVATTTPAPVVTPLAELQLTPTPPAPVPTPTPPLAPPLAEAGKTTDSTAHPPESAPPVVLPNFAQGTNKPAPAAAPSSESPLEPPNALAGKIGLSWGQLTDIVHRTPPRRITLICDKAFEKLGQEISQELQVGLPSEVSLLVTTASTRADETLLSRVQSSQPDLVIDLMASPVPAIADESAETPTVWVVHEALWPQDREAKKGDNNLDQRYRRHQFQSLALGSLLRTELGRQFPEHPVPYELAPSYLLRRVDAPSAEVLIPTSTGEEAQDSEKTKQLASAVSGAVRSYIRGMQQVQF